MEKIFNPFEQGERSFQRRFGGIGLGLTISKSLAQAHGASLVAKSEGLNRGATFLLTIKTAELDEAETPRPAEPPRAPAGLRILLVDDHPDTCAALERLLKLRGHAVTAAHNMRGAPEMEGASTDIHQPADIPDETALRLPGNPFGESTLNAEAFLALHPLVELGKRRALRAGHCAGGGRERAARKLRQQTALIREMHTSSFLRERLIDNRGGEADFLADVETTRSSVLSPRIEKALTLMTPSWAEPS